MRGSELRCRRGLAQAGRARAAWRRPRWRRSSVVSRSHGTSSPEKKLRRMRLVRCPWAARRRAAAGRRGAAAPPRPRIRWRRASGLCGSTGPGPPWAAAEAIRTTRRPLTRLTVRRRVDDPGVVEDHVGAARQPGDRGSRGASVGRGDHAAQRQAPGLQVVPGRWIARRSRVRRSGRRTRRRGRRTEGRGPRRCRRRADRASPRSQRRATRWVASGASAASPSAEPDSEADGLGDGPGEPPSPGGPGVPSVRTGLPRASARTVSATAGSINQDREWPRAALPSSTASWSTPVRRLSVQPSGSSIAPSEPRTTPARTGSTRAVSTCRRGGRPRHQRQERAVPTDRDPVATLAVVPEDVDAEPVDAGRGDAQRRARQPDLERLGLTGQQGGDLVEGAWNGDPAADVGGQRGLGGASRARRWW